MFPNIEVHNLRLEDLRGVSDRARLIRLATRRESRSVRTRVLAPVGRALVRSGSFLLTLSERKSDGKTPERIACVTP